jgi:hydroxyethylthiazole kinase-like uncharacterized protein yjeF
LSTPRPILTPAELDLADQSAVQSGTSLVQLMERAGQAVADSIRSAFSPRPVVIWCGPGNNGGDGYVVARLLKRRGWSVRVEALEPPRSAAAKEAARRWRGETAPISTQLNGQTLYVDALFGSGLARSLSGPAAVLARASKASRNQIVAIDVPSGISGETGQPLGPEAFWAGTTVTFHCRKPAHALEPGRVHCGDIRVADIGLPAVSSQLWENDPDLFGSFMPWPDVADHKHTRGRLFVVTGGPHQTGAGRLAARGGLRVGAGVVTVLSPPDAMAINAAHLEAIMLKQVTSAADYATAAADADAVVIGPAAGVGETTREALLALARTGGALVVDADALTSFRHDPEQLFTVLDRDDVLTPHPGEFERLFPGLLAQPGGRLQAARKAAALAGAVVLLKGPDTVIAAEDGRAAINLNGSPWLATAGSGDVLAGLIAGLIAQGMDSFMAACAGVWIHAEAGSGFGPGLTAEDLPGRVPAVLARLFNGR